MKILLLYDQFLPEIHWNCLKAQEKNMGAIPPLNLCYVASVAQEFGHQAEIVDLQAKNHTFTELVGRIKTCAPDLLGFTITTYLFHPVLEWIGAIKREVRIPVLVGGFHVGLYPRQTMAHKEIDLAVIGNRKETLRDLLNNFGDSGAYKHIEGLCYRKGKEISVNHLTREPYVNLDELPFPARNLLDNEAYGNFISRRKNFTAMLTGIGCPFRCRYCASTLGRCLMRSPENVVAEIEECYREYGIREIDFYDQSFTVDRARTVKICELIKKRRIDILWTIRTRADLIDEELLEIMKSAGLYRIMYGVESGSQKILNRLNKQEKLEDIKYKVRATRKHGISAFGFFMIGCPGETKDTLRLTKKLALSLPFDEIQATRFTLFPGTPLYEEYLKKTGKKDYWSEYVLNRGNARRLPLLDTVFTPQQAEKQVRVLYLAFYLRPQNLIRKLKDGDLFRNYRKYLRAVWDMIFGQ